MAKPKSQIPNPKSQIKTLSGLVDRLGFGIWALGFMNDAYASCERDARSHYENFPVASWLLPKRMRRHVAAVYAFARAADDFADEGDRPPAARLALLDGWKRRLHQSI